MLDNQEICNLYNQGQSQKEIALQYNYSGSGIDKILTLGIKDKEHLEKFKKSITADYPISIVKCKPNNCCRIKITSLNLYNNLNRLGCVPRRIKNIDLKLISKELMNHFIRGVFDGDGCISSYKREKSIKNSFTLAGSFSLVNNIQQYLIDVLELSKTKISKLGKSKNSHYFTYASFGEVLKIRDFLYKDANVFLARKKEKFNLIREK